MPNPYELLKVPRNASIQVIEDAYDRMFDRYEPDAQDGDPDAVEMLTALNAARDLLLDPKRRAALDKSLGQARPAPTTQAARATGDRRPVGASRSSGASTPVPTTATNRQSTIIKTRPRSRPVDVRQPRSLSSILPFFIIAIFLAFLLAVAVTYLLNRGSDRSSGQVPQGAVVATVNGEPIYTREFDEQVARDKAAALSDPMFGALFNNFQGITGTRALELLKYDALDKLINMQVLVQQSKKEGLYPTDAQAESLVSQAKASDLKSGVSFEDFLKQHNIDEAKYRKTVIDNIVYTVMANQHLPKEGTAEVRTNAFIQYICTTRQSYDVKILMQFTVSGNQPCTSGLPSDLPLPGIDQSAPPEPASTTAPAVTPGTHTAPAPQATAVPTQKVP